MHSYEVIKSTYTHTYTHYPQNCLNLSTINLCKKRLLPQSFKFLHITKKEDFFYISLEETLLLLIIHDSRILIPSPDDRLKLSHFERLLGTFCYQLQQSSLHYLYIISKVVRRKVFLLF